MAECKALPGSAVKGLRFWFGNRGPWLSAAEAVPQFDSGQYSTASGESSKTSRL